MKLNIIWTIFRKELTDMMRDRRTMLSMIVIPALGIPLLMYVVVNFSISQSTKVMAETKTIVVEGLAADDPLFPMITELPNVQIADRDTLAEEFSVLIENKELEAALIFPEDFQQRVEQVFNGSGDIPEVRILYDESRLKSKSTFKMLSRTLTDHRDQLLSGFLDRVQISGDVLNSFLISGENVLTEQELASSMIGRFVAYMIMILVVSSAIYPALDLTVGEKERQTLETLLTTPVNRLSIAIGKFLTINSIAVIATLITLISFALTSRAFTGMEGVDLSMIQIKWNAILLVFLFMVPLTMLFTAVLMTLGVFARSQKEGQSYAQPLVFVVIVPAITAMMPGMELNWRLAMIPLVNTSLSIRELFVLNGQAWPIIVFVFAYNLVLAAIMLFIVTRMFEKESVVFRMS